MVLSQAYYQLTLLFTIWKKLMPTIFLVVLTIQSEEKLTFRYHLVQVLASTSLLD